MSPNLTLQGVTIGVNIQTRLNALRMSAKESYQEKVRPERDGVHIFIKLFNSSHEDEDNIVDFHIFMLDNFNYTHRI